MVELMCNETFENKDPDEAMEYLDILAENAQNWDITGTCEVPSKTQPHTSSGGMYNLREDHDLHAKFTSLPRKVEALEFKKSGQLNLFKTLCVKIKKYYIYYIILNQCYIKGSNKKYSRTKIKIK